MEFPRVGLIRRLTDGAILVSWQYAATADTSDVLEGDCPFADYDPTLHEIEDLTIYTPEEYVQIADKHHETRLEKEEGQPPKFVKVDAEGEKRPHPVVGKERPEKPPKVDPPEIEPPLVEEPLEPPE